MSFTVTIAGVSPNDLKKNISLMLEHLNEVPTDQMVLPFKSAVAAPKPPEPKEEDSKTEEAPIAEPAETTTKRVRRTKSQIEAEAPTAKPAETPVPPTPTATPTPTKAEITQLVIKLNQMCGIEACRVALGKVGAQQMSHVSEDKYSELAALCNEELAKAAQDKNAAESVL